MPGSVDDAWRYLGDRFGIQSGDLPGLDLRPIGRDFWLVSTGLTTSLRTESLGLRLLRRDRAGFKPTTYGLQLLGPLLRRNVVDITREEAMVLLEGRSIPKRLDEEGYVALRMERRVIGCGLYQRGQLASLIPKARARELIEVLSK